VSELAPSFAAVDRGQGSNLPEDPPGGAGRSLARLSLYAVLARKSFRRMTAYRTATIAGLITNLFFGLLRAYIFIALYEASGDARVAGYSLRDVITYTALSQALIGPMMIWGSREIMDTIQSGQIASDLCKPFDFQLFWLSRDLGRAAFEFLGRGVPLFLAYGLVFDLSWPQHLGGWFAFFVSMTLGVVVSFNWRFLINLSAFWIVDANGVSRIAFLGILLFTGLMMPLSFFPDGLASFAKALPFAAYVNTPAEVFLGQVQGAALGRALAHQAFWAIALGLVGRAVYRRGVHKLVVQGG
jgi:ABC-2 type transport system permease protein